MTETLLLCVQVAVAIWMCMMLLAPLVVFWLSASPCSYVLVDQEPDEALKSADPAFLAAKKQLQELGFSLSRCSSIGMSHARTSFSVFRKPGDNCLATVSLCSTAYSTVAAVEFSQIYVGYSCLSLTSSRLPPVYPKWHERRTFRLPGATDVHELSSRFNVLRERCSLGSQVDLAPGEELTALEILMNREVERLCEVGYLSEKCHKGNRKSSLRGAYIMSWRVLPPWRNVILARERRLTLAASET